MKDSLPIHGMLQQNHARPVSGEHLEILGKNAAANWRCGKVQTLTDAVVGAVKQAGLAPEQVRRVVEFANTDAFLGEFRKESASTKVVDFGRGGPASYADVLRDLNDGGSPAYDHGGYDYASPPQEKLSSALEEDAFYSALSAKGPTEYPLAEPLSEAMQMRDKLAGVHDLLNAQLSQVEVQLMELTDRVYAQVKQASLSGHALGEVLRVLEPVTPSVDHVKVAFDAIIPRLIREGVFPNILVAARSFEKTGSANIVPNPDHPLAHDFGDYCLALDKMAELRVARRDVAESLVEMDAFLLKVAKGAWTAVKDGAKALGGKAEKGVAKTLDWALGNEGGGAVRKYAPKVVGKVVEKTPHAVAGLGAYHLYRKGQETAATPMGSKAVEILAPWSDQSRQAHEYRMARAQGLV
jgi:hypothetical protein